MGSAKLLQDIHDWFGRYDDYDAVLVKTESIAWRFRVTCGGKSTEVLIPFKPTDTQLRNIDRQLLKYFQMFGVK